MISRRSFIGALATAAGALVVPELFLPSGKTTFVYGTGARDLPSPLFIWHNPGEFHKAIAEFYNDTLREHFLPVMVEQMEGLEKQRALLGNLPWSTVP